MSEAAVRYLRKQFTQAIDYARLEYDLNFVELIGLLAIFQDDATHEAREQENDDADPEMHEGR